MAHPPQAPGVSPVLGQKEGISQQEQQGAEASTFETEQKNPLRWSSEALKVINRHLSLLKTAYAANITGLKRVEEQDRGLEAGETAKRFRSTIGVLDHAADDDVKPCVELASHIPLPDGWEQFLNLKTGQAYYIDWKTCRRSYADPRSVVHQSQSRAEILQYPMRRWKLHPKCAVPVASDGVSDGCNYAEKPDSDERGEVNSNLVTSPMLEEDWDLMKLRGWLTLSTDNQSEITSAIKACPVPVEGKREEMHPSGTDNLTPWLLFPS